MSIMQHATQYLCSCSFIWTECDPHIRMTFGEFSEGSETNAHSSFFAFRFGSVSSSRPNDSTIKEYNNYGPDVVTNSPCVYEKTNKIWKVANIL